MSGCACPAHSPLLGGAGTPGGGKTIYNDPSPETNSILLSNTKTVFTQCVLCTEFSRNATNQQIEARQLFALLNLPWVVSITESHWRQQRAGVWTPDRHWAPPWLRPVYSHSASSIYRFKQRDILLELLFLLFLLYLIGRAWYWFFFPSNVYR